MASTNAGAMRVCQLGHKDRKLEPYSVDWVAWCMSMWEQNPRECGILDEFKDEETFSARRNAYTYVADRPGCHSIGTQRDQPERKPARQEGGQNARILVGCGL